MAVKLELAPDESAFLVATDEEIQAFAGMTEEERPKGGKGTEFCLSGPWTVQFDPAMGGPDKPVKFKQLADWTDHPDPRIRYYSGTAVYTTRFRWRPAGGNGRKGDSGSSSGMTGGDTMTLQLDGLNGMAKVVINGQDAGTVWCSPWRIDITDYLKPGRNEVRLEVTNSLYNRMIGDAVEHPDNPAAAYTHSSFPLVDADTPLVPSGLLGVRLLAK